MKTKMVLTMIVIMVLFSVPAFAEESFKGLVPMTAEGLYIAGTNLDVAVVAVATRPHEVLGGGVKGVCIAGDAMIKTTDMLVDMTADGLWTAGTNLDVAVVAVATRPHEVVGGGVGLVCKGAGAIFKCVFGP